MKKQLLYIAIILLIASCRKDIAPENPCEGQEEVKADFIIEDGDFDPRNPPRYSEVDSVVFGVGSVRYTVLTPNIDSCRWFLGAEQITQRQFIRNSYPAATKIEVTLIVYKNYKPGCTKNFKTSDTLTKSFYTYPIDASGNSLGFWTGFGTYAGYKKSNPAQRIEVEIGYLPRTQFLNQDGSYITNIPYNGYVSKKYLVDAIGQERWPWTAVSPTGNNVFSLNSPNVMEGLPEDKKFWNYGTRVKNQITLKYYYLRDTLSNGDGDPQSPILYDEFIGYKIK
jgi:hypothetical protein